jgi:hypothetical protein
MSATPRAYRPATGGPLERGTASIDKSGWMRVNVADLRSAGIKSHATIVLDREGRRIGLRSSRPGEFAVTAHGADRKGTKSLGFKAGRALRSIGVEPQSVAGWYDVTNIDGALIVQLPRPASPIGTAAREESRA